MSKQKSCPSTIKARSPTTTGVCESGALLNRINTRYTRYLESHELCLATTASGNEDLTASHETTETEHNQVVDKLQAYIAESAKPPTPRIGSLFSSRSSSRNLQLKSLFRGSRCSPSQVSSTRSEKLIEARVQAELTKKRSEQLKAVQEMKQHKYELELEAAKRQKQLEDEIEMQESVNKLEELNAEVVIRQQEEIRNELGSDYESDGER